MATSAPPALGAHHNVRISEVYPAASASEAFVELQMATTGENLVDNQDLNVYGPTGVLVNSFQFDANAESGQAQRTILVGGDGVGARDFTDSTLGLAAAGGGLCFESSTFDRAIDCVSWGNFTGGLPDDGAGFPASPAGVSSGSSLTRSIAANCPAQLELADDTHNSVADFFEATPTPTGNSTPATAPQCPDTTIAASPRPPLFTNQTTATFNFSGTGGAGAPYTFECRLDTEPGFTDCSAGTKQYTDVPAGQRTFSVRAISGGLADPTPATYTWTVDLTPPDTTISPAGLPSDPTASPTATFAFTSTEALSTFRCKLDLAAEETCTTGKSYSNLQTGEHTFSVYAVDRAGNPDTSPASYTWDVDRTPPTTSIVTAPANPSPVNFATFIFTSESGATFSCKLDDFPAQNCDLGEVSYSSLNDGSHTFRVRATDALGNVEVIENTGANGNTYIWTVDATTDPPPESEITKAPKRRGTDRTPTIRFRADPPAGASFECRIDDKPYADCESPHTTRRLKLGKHTFRVLATGPGGVEPEPAKATFRIVKP